MLHCLWKIRIYIILKNLSRCKEHDTYNKFKCFFILGLHHFYLEKWLRGTIDLILFAAGIGLLIFGTSVAFGINCILAILVIELPQLYTYSDPVHAYNNNLMKRLLYKLKC